jgi:hypothetical protein
LDASDAAHGACVLEVVRTFTYIFGDGLALPSSAGARGDGSAMTGGGQSGWSRPTTEIVTALVCCSPFIQWPALVPAVIHTWLSGDLNFDTKTKDVDTKSQKAEATTSTLLTSSSSSSTTTTTKSKGVTAGSQRDAASVRAAASWIATVHAMIASLISTLEWCLQYGSEYGVPLTDDDAIRAATPFDRSQDQQSSASLLWGNMNHGFGGGIPTGSRPSLDRRSDRTNRTNPMVPEFNTQRIWGTMLPRQRATPQPNPFLTSFRSATSTSAFGSGSGSAWGAGAQAPSSPRPTPRPLLFEPRANEWLSMNGPIKPVPDITIPLSIHGLRVLHQYWKEFLATIDMQRKYFSSSSFFSS